MARDPDVPRSDAQESGTTTSVRCGERVKTILPIHDEKAYEEKRWRIDPPDPIDAIKIRMEQRGLSRKDLEQVLGSRSRVSEILKRKRPLTSEMIRKLHRDLAIPAESLIPADTPTPHGSPTPPACRLI